MRNYSPMNCTVLEPENPEPQLSTLVQHSTHLDGSNGYIACRADATGTFPVLKGLDAQGRVRPQPEEADKHLCNNSITTAHQQAHEVPKLGCLKKHRGRQPCE